MTPAPKRVPADHSAGSAPIPCGGSIPSSTWASRFNGKIVAVRRPTRSSADPETSRERIQERRLKSEFIVLKASRYDRLRRGHAQAGGLHAWRSATTSIPVGAGSASVAGLGFSGSVSAWLTGKTRSRPTGQGPLGWGSLKRRSPENRVLDCRSGPWPLGWPGLFFSHFHPPG